MCTKLGDKRQADRMGLVLGPPGQGEPSISPGGIVNPLVGTAACQIFVIVFNPPNNPVALTLCYWEAPCSEVG